MIAGTQKNNDEQHIPKNLFTKEFKYFFFLLLKKSKLRHNNFLIFRVSTEQYAKERRRSIRNIQIQLLPCRQIEPFYKAIKFNKRKKLPSLGRIHIKGHNKPLMKIQYLHN